MNTQFLRNMVLVSVVLLAAGCANNPFYHRYVMAGQVVQASDGRTVICIGEPNGAEVGQVLDAYRTVFRTDVVEEGGSDWAREWVGKVSVDGIIDEHFATVDVVEGKIMKNDIVELEYL
jgi:hypothetical protein